MHKPEEEKELLEERAEKPVKQSYIPTLWISKKMKKSKLSSG